MSEKSRLEALARMVAAEIDGSPERPKLRLVRREDFAATLSGLDAPTRGLYCNRIRDIARLYRLDWLVRQECSATYGAIEALDDDDLVDLHSTMERARECVVEGVSLDEAGLVRAPRIPS